MERRGNVAGKRREGDERKKERKKRMGAIPLKRKVSSHLSSNLSRSVLSLVRQGWFVYTGQPSSTLVLGACSSPQG